MAHFTYHVVGTALGCAAVWLTVDAIDEMLLYLKARGKGMSRVRENEQLMSVLGGEAAPGPWYNSSVRKSGERFIQCTFPVDGRLLGTEVAITMVRAKGGCPTTIMHNTVCSGEWEVAVCRAVLSGEGGLPRHVDLGEVRTSPSNEENKTTDGS